MRKQVNLLTKNSIDLDLVQGISMFLSFSTCNHNSIAIDHCVILHFNAFSEDLYWIYCPANSIARLEIQCWRKFSISNREYDHAVLSIQLLKSKFK
uniref:Uncharacterized protein n=1 Tax=Arundo donax TaxID=35708 RepID=A0A0A9D792_ARUDO